MKIKRAWEILLRIILAALLVVMVMPLAMLCTDSLMGKQEIMESFGAVLEDYGAMAKVRFFPRYPTMRAYVRLLFDSPEYFTAFWNSMILAGGVAAGQIFAAVPAAWGLARFNFPGKKAIWFLYMLLLLLPFQVTMVSGYLVLESLKLMDTDRKSVV